MKIKVIILALAAAGLFTGCGDNQEDASKDRPKSEVAEKTQPAQAPAQPPAAQQEAAPQTAQPQPSPSEQEALMVIKEHMAKMEAEGVQEGELEAPLEEGDKAAKATEEAAAASAAKVKEAMQKAMPQEAKEAIEKAQEGATTIISPVIQTQAPAANTTADTSPTETAPTETAPTETAPTETAPTETAKTAEPTSPEPAKADPCAMLGNITVAQQQQTVEALTAKLMQGDTSVTAEEFQQEVDLLLNLKKCQ